MKENLLFQKVKDDGVTHETFIEHATKTYQVGKFLFDTLNLKFDKKKFLYCCFFHDVGKLAIELGRGPHTTKSREGLELMRGAMEYEILIRNLELEDYSKDEEIINAIERHHDSTSSFEAFVSIADQIASSSSNEDLKNRIRSKPISSLITYLNEMHDFHKLNFFSLSIPSFSKNELNVVGKLLLLKMLFETVNSLPEIEILYETLDGCRVVTMLDREESISRISREFNLNFIRFFENQPIGQILGGSPDGFKQYTTLPKEIRGKLTGLTVEKYKRDILNSLKSKKIETLEDMGISNQILYSFATSSELGDFCSNIRGTKYALLCDREGKYSKWIAKTFAIKKKKTEIVEENKPIIEELLEKAGADISKITNKDVLYSKLYPLVVAINSLNSSEACFTFDISNFLKVDSVVPLGEVAVKNICANCGAFEGRIPLETFTFGYRQHYRESLFTETNSSVRDGNIYVCNLCHAEALLNVALCGVTIENQRARINTKTHLVLYGLDIGRDLLEELTDRKLVEKLLKDYRIMRENVYVRDKQDMQIFFYSLDETKAGIKNSYFRNLLFSLIATRLNEQNPLLLAFSINMLPNYLESSILQSPEGDLNIVEGDSLDFFHYVLCLSLTPEEQRDYILQYHGKPLIGVAQILKREKIRYDEETEKVVKNLKKGDVLFELMDEIWEMAKIGGALETKKNVGSFLGVFKGRAEDLDRIVNKFMKNDKLSPVDRNKIIEIHLRLREELGALDEDKRRKLKDYAQKTKYLFNSKKFHEIGKESGKNE